MYFKFRKNIFSFVIKVLVVSLVFITIMTIYDYINAHIEAEKNTFIYKTDKQTVKIDYEPTELSYSDFLLSLDTDEIKDIYFTEKSNYFYAIKGGVVYIVDSPMVDTFREQMLKEGIAIHPFDNVILVQNIKWFTNTQAAILGLFLGCLFVYFNDKRKKKKKPIGMNIGNIKDMKPKENTFSFNLAEDLGMESDSGYDKSTFYDEKDDKKVFFKDVAGLSEVKEDMKSLVDFLVNKDKYNEAGAKLPKGVILYGPPGTGKTLLARAIAGEANVPFIYMSGSDFIEMYVGVGPKRVRELFKKAKDNAPCIVFIDEIDAIGGKRSLHANSEDRKTINALLTEMDGFNQTDNILVIGATNRVDDLDGALLRPGRFTNKFCIPLPQTSAERLEVIEMYSKNKKLCDDVDLDSLAKETVGFSPAQIESLLNEAAILSIQKGMAYITKAVIDEALMKIVLQGHIKKDQTGRDERELELVAWHEAGHALMGILHGKDVSKVTILASTSGAGGVTFTIPDKEHLLSVEDLKKQVKELYSGRIAELLLYENSEQITTGASNDIEKATSIIKDIITAYGMDSKFGLLNLADLNVPQDVLIEKEVELAKQLEEEATQILTENKTKLKAIAIRLLEEETLYSKDLQEIFEEN